MDEKNKPARKCYSLQGGLGRGLLSRRLLIASGTGSSQCCSDRRSHTHTLWGSIARLCVCSISIPTAAHARLDQVVVAIRAPRALSRVGVTTGPPQAHRQQARRASSRNHLGFKADRVILSSACNRRPRLSRKGRGREPTRGPAATMASVAVAQTYCTTIPIRLCERTRVHTSGPGQRACGRKESSARSGMFVISGRSENPASQRIRGSGHMQAWGGLGEIRRVATFRQDQFSSNSALGAQRFEVRRSSATLLGPSGRLLEDCDLGVPHLAVVG